MKMFSFQYKTAKNQFYLLMMLIVNKTQLNLRSQNRTHKTGFGCASTGFACPILGPSILASSYFQYSPHTFGSVYYLSTQFLPKVVYILKVCPFLFPPWLHFSVGTCVGTISSARSSPVVVTAAVTKLAPGLSQPAVQITWQKLQL